jgi:hypothetical protein
VVRRLSLPRSSPTTADRLAPNRRIERTRLAIFASRVRILDIRCQERRWRKVEPQGSERRLLSQSLWLTAPLASFQ